MSVAGIGLRLRLSDCSMSALSALLSGGDLALELVAPVPKVLDRSRLAPVAVAAVPVAAAHHQPHRKRAGEDENEKQVAAHRQSFRVISMPRGWSGDVKD